MLPQRQPSALLDQEDSICDEDIVDLLSGDLYTREWKLVGTEPPSDDGDYAEHLCLQFVQAAEYADERDLSGIRLRPFVLTPISSESEAVEVLPVTRSTLGKYFDYFAGCVTTDTKHELLINVCRRQFKAPVFDISGCKLVVPKSNVLPSNFIGIDLSGVSCVPLIPASIVCNITDSLATIGFFVAPSYHDAYAYGCSRIRMSKIYTECEFDRACWKGNTYTRDFSRIIKCRAVATATFTVSAVLSPYVGSRSVYASKKILTFVIHAIK